LLYFYKTTIFIVQKNLTTANGHLPNADCVIGVPGEQGLSVCGPRERQALWWFGFAGGGDDFGFEFLDHFLALEIPDFDPWSKSGAEPVAVWREAEGGDDVVVVKGVQVLAVVQVPKHRFAVLATRCAEGTVWGNGDGVEVTRVSVVVDLQPAVGQVPDLDNAVPSSGYDDGVGVVWREPDAADPVAVSIVLDGVFALGQSVPQLNSLVSRSRHDLSVVNGESNAQDVLSMVLEPPRGASSSQIPETEGLVPGTGQGVVTVGRENDVADEVGVSVETLLWDTIVGLVASQFPNDQSLVT